MAVYKRIWKRRNGSTAFCWYFHRTIDGERYRDAIKTARTRAQAMEAERELLSRIHQGIYSKRDTRSFGEVVNEIYIPWTKANKKSFKTDLGMLKPLMNRFTEKKLWQISSLDVEKYKSDRRRTQIHGHPVSVSTVNKELKLLSKVFKLADVKKNPCDNVAKLKGEVKRKRYLKPDEEARLVAGIRTKYPHLWSIIVLDLNTGMRRGELLNLRLDDIDFVRGTIRVFGSKTETERIIPMNKTARSLVEDLVGTARLKGWEYLFTNPATGTRYKEIKRSFSRALRDADIKDFRFHDLRHTFGTRAVDNGAPLTGVRDALGHASLETTNRYAHGTDEGKRRAVEAQHWNSENLGHIAVTQQEKQAG